MENHQADPLDLAQLAALSGVGARQLNRLYQQHFGVSCMAFYRQLRLDTAAALLQQSALPVTEIALATGFGNPAHFATVFRERFGRGPRDYRLGAGG
ncbi:MAG: helix-turn-helix domain-containing protein [Thiolinea sp.]